jgi:transposase
LNKILQSDNTNPAIQEVKAAMKNTKDKRMFERYQSILLHLKGMTYEQIAGIVGRSIVTINSYVKVYREKGLDGLQMGQSPGRPTFLTEEQEQELYQLIVEQRPADVGFPAEMNWNAPLIRDWIKREFGVTYAERGVRKLLYRLGFSYTKPTYTLAKADPEKQAAFKEQFETTKKNDGWQN